MPAPTNRHTTSQQEPRCRSLRGVDALEVGEQLLQAVQAVRPAGREAERGSEVLAVVGLRQHPLTGVVGVEALRETVLQPVRDTGDLEALRTLDDAGRDARPLLLELCCGHDSSLVASSIALSAACRSA